MRSKNAKSKGQKIIAKILRVKECKEKEEEAHNQANEWLNNMREATD